MTQTFTIARRELASFFRLPVGWITIALYALLSGIVFCLTILIPGQPATLRALFSISGWLLLPVVPAISMRLLSDEFRSGTIEPLMTSPASDAAIIVGKYLGAAGFLVLALVPTLLQAMALWLLAEPKPDPGPIASGYLSLVLAGMLFLSVGTLASTLTSNQTLAFLSTFFVLLILLILSVIGPAPIPAFARPAVAALAIGPRLADFARGVIDTSHIVFFVSASLFFLSLAYAALQSRRWR